MPVLNAAPASVAGLSAADRHLLTRFSGGLDPALAQSAVAAGGARAWLQQQLSPGTIPDEPGAQVDSWFPVLQASPETLWARYKRDRSVTSTVASDNLAQRTLMRRIRSRRQVLEVMTDFWSNLLHVASPDDSCWTHRHTYDATIRQHALGRFDEMLRACVLHPAMLLYLDNYASTKSAPNENLGRELLECHTVGRETAYTEADVLNSTRILTGWHVDRLGTSSPSYRGADHHTGPVRVLGFRDANSSADGRGTTYRYLHYLAHHPATARRVARALATRFVSDTPSPALVAHLAAVFTKSGTSIPATLRALVAHPSFTGATRTKVRTPTEDFVATTRALRAEISQPRAEDDFARQTLYYAMQIGQRPFAWPTPDGFPDAGPAWSSATRMLGSWNTHHAMVGGVIKGGVSYPKLASWLPALPARFDTIVRNVSQRLLFEVPTESVVQAACASVGVRRDEVLRPGHPFTTERVHLLLACLLDSPFHLTR